MAEIAVPVGEENLLPPVDPIIVPPPGDPIIVAPAVGAIPGAANPANNPADQLIIDFDCLDTRGIRFACAILGENSIGSRNDCEQRLRLSTGADPQHPKPPGFYAPDQPIMKLSRNQLLALLEMLDAEPPHTGGKGELSIKIFRITNPTLFGDGRFINPLVPPIVTPAILPEPPATDEFRTSALDNPRSITLIDLKDLADHNRIDSWTKDVEETAASRMCWDNTLAILSSKTTEINTQENKDQIVTSLNEYQRQFFVILRQSMRNSMGRGLRASIESKITAGACGETAWGILEYIRSQKEYLGDALAVKAKSQFDRAEWRGSQISLEAYANTLRLYLSQCGPTIPAGIPREHLLRERIAKVIKSGKSPAIDFLVNKIMLNDLTDPEGSVDYMIKSVSKEMFKKDNTSVEKQASVFSCFINGNGSENLKKTNIAAVNAVLDQDMEENMTGGSSSSNGNSSNNSTSTSSQPPVSVNFTNYQGSKGGGGKGGYNSWNKLNNSTPNEHCYSCAKYYKSNNITDKQHVVSSHSDNTCQFKRAKDKNASNNNNPFHTSNAKKGGKGNKKKGKGKGKKTFSKSKKPFNKKPGNGGGKKGGRKGGGRKNEW